MRRRERDQLDRQWDQLAAQLAPDSTPDAALRSIRMLTSTPLRRPLLKTAVRGGHSACWGWSLGGSAAMRAGNLVGLTALVIALIAGAVFAWPAVQRPTSPMSTGESRLMWVYGDAGEALELDPQTLATVRTTSIGLDDDMGSVQLSGDGSTVIKFVSAPPEYGVIQSITTSVYDADSGELRLTIAPIGDSFPMALSADGRRILFRSPTPADGVTVVNTWTGEVISKFNPMPPVTQFPYMSIAVDRDVTTMYALTVDRVTGVGPWPATLHAWDLATATQIGERELPEIRAGMWQAYGSPTHSGCPEQSAYQPSVTALFGPGMALSPDGSTIAIFSGDDRLLLTLDATTLDQTSMSAIPASPLTDRLNPAINCLGQVQQSRTVTFNASGDAIYVTGEALLVDPVTWDEIRLSLGLRKIDPVSGEVIAELAPDRLPADFIVSQLLSPADGNDLYIGITRFPGWANRKAEHATPWAERTEPAFGMMRLDPETLGIEATRIDLPVGGAQVIESS